MPVPPVAMRRRTRTPSGAVWAAHAVSLSPPADVRSGAGTPRCGRRAAAARGGRRESRRVEATGRWLAAIACGGEVSTALLSQRLPPACRRDADLRVRRLDRRRRSARRIRRAALVRPLRTTRSRSHRASWLGSCPARGRIRPAAAQRGRSRCVGRGGSGGRPSGARSGGSRRHRRTGRPPWTPTGDPATTLTVRAAARPPYLGAAVGATVSASADSTRRRVAARHARMPSTPAVVPMANEAMINAACTHRKDVGAPCPTEPVDQARPSSQMASANRGQMAQFQTPTPIRKAAQPREIVTRRA
jgi:hypothetical protein